VRRTLAATLRKLKIARDTSCEVFLVADAAMGRLNWRTRRKRGPTTVLSFPVCVGRHALSTVEGFPRPDLGGRGRYLGEIYLAPDCARRRAMPLGLLAVHGLLHLLGYTHKGKRDTIDMEREEKRLLKVLKP
jgi:probable rRNA maturation factor